MNRIYATAVGRCAVLLCCCLFLFVSPVRGQVDLSPSFQTKLEAAGLEFIEPLEARYKDIRVVRNAFLDYDFAMRSRREGLEIRYYIDPAGPGATAVPHVEAVRLLMHLASNEERYIMSGVDVKDFDLKEQFNADWGKVFFFTPKETFSPRRQCKMLALFREGYGMAFVFFLFNEAGPALDHRFYALRFQEKENN